MEFDKSRVYTAVNADELKIGSKVIVADYLKTLKKNVATGENIKILGSVWEEDFKSRFEVVGMSYRWLLAYLVSEPEEKVLEWTDLKIGDVIRHKVSGIEYMITGLDERNTDYHTYFANVWASDSNLKKYEKVEEQND